MLRANGGASIGSRRPPHERGGGRRAPRRSQTRNQKSKVASVGSTCTAASRTLCWMGWVAGWGSHGGHCPPPSAIATADVDNRASATRRIARLRVLVAMGCRLLPAQPVGGFRHVAGHGGGHRQRTCLQMANRLASYEKLRNPMARQEMQAKSTAE